MIIYTPLIQNRYFKEITLKVPEIADIFRFSSSEVDKILDLASPLHGLIVGKIISAQPHPNADRLQVCLVDCGQTALRQIICGATNARPNVLTVVALPGTLLFPKQGQPITIQSTTIRDVLSNGMLCAFEEIGLPFSGKGIIELELGIPGQSASEALGITGASLDLEITPNRPDLLSYQGLARELAAVQDIPFIPLAQADITSTQKDPYPDAVRFMSIKIENILVGPSPYWLQRDIWASGLKPINCLVDLGNYVMLETGQPLHTYDAKTIAGELTVRAATQSETLTCLDGSLRTLNESDIIVTDQSNVPLSIAGIIGGAATKVTEATTSIVLEAASFPGTRIRETSRRLGLRSEASLRMEKENDSVGCEIALRRFVWWIQHLFPLAKIGEVTDHFATTHQPLPVSLQIEQLNRVLGTHISAEESVDILKRLGFKVSLSEQELIALPPHWRSDVWLPEDLIEEIIRIRGYETLPSTLPSGELSAPQSNSRYEKTLNVCKHFATAGWNQSIHISLTSEVALKRMLLSPELCQPVLLPLSAEVEYLIPSHAVSFLNNIATINRELKIVRLFEYGAVFKQPLIEEQRLSAIGVGGEVEALFRQLLGTYVVAFPGLTTKPCTECPAYLDPKRTANLIIGTQAVGWIGAFLPEVLEAWDITGEPLFAELTLGSWFDSLQSRSRFNPERMQAFTRDITLPQSGTVGEVIDSIQRAITGKSLIALDLLDQYAAGEQRTATFRLTFSGNQAEADAALNTLLK